MAEDNPTPELNGLLAERLDRIERALAEYMARLEAAERQIGLAPHRAENAASLPPAPESTGNLSASEGAYGTARQLEARPAATVAAKPPQRQPAFQPPPKPRRDWKHKWGDVEQRVGGSLFNWIGIVALAFATAFFLKYAFENEWIGPGSRVLTGLVVGVSLLVAAERLRARGYASYAYGLTGGGVMILYLTIYAAFDFYSMIGQLPAFVLMALVTATAVLLAARWNALPIAILGLIGGFLTPPLLSTGIDNYKGLFSYVAFLNAGVLALGYRKQWRSLNYLAFVATMFTVLGWMLAWYERWKLGGSLFFLTLFFLIFASLSVLQHLAKKQPTRALDLTLIVTNAVFYFGMSYVLLNGTEYKRLLGLFALVLAALYAGLVAAAAQRSPDDRALSVSFLSASVILATVAAAIQFDRHWLTIAWSLEGAALVLTGWRAQARAIAYAAWPVFALAALHWLIVDAGGLLAERGAAFVPLWNSRVLACAALVGALALASQIARRSFAQGGAEGRNLFGDSLTIAAHALAVIALSMEANDFFASRVRAQALLGDQMGDSFAQQLALSLVWTLYGGALLMYGLARGSRLARALALLLLTLATLKVFFLDLSSLERFYRIISFVVLGAILLAVSFLYQQRLRRTNDEEERLAAAEERA